MLILSFYSIPKAKDTKFHNQMLLKIEAEATSQRVPRPRPRPEVTRPRPRPKFWPWGQFGLEALTSLEITALLL